MSLTADLILKANQLPRQSFSVPEWGGHVCVQTLSVAERSDIEDEVARQARNGGVKSLNFRQRLLCKTVVDDDGQPVFKPEHIGALNSAVVERLFERSLQLNGFSKSDKDTLEQAEGN